MRVNVDINCNLMLDREIVNLRLSLYVFEIN